MPVEQHIDDAYFMTGTHKRPPVDFSSCSLGSELLTNGDFESGFTAGLADGWLNPNSQTVSEETSNIHGGSSAQKVLTSDDTELNYVDVAYTTTTGRVYKVSCWVYQYTSNENGNFYLGTQGIYRSHSGIKNTWTQLSNYFTSITTGSSFFNVVQSTYTLNDYIIIDDCSAKEVLLPLVDPGADFLSCGVIADMLVKNTTDGSEGTITSVTEDEVYATLSGGTNNNWVKGDEYEIYLTGTENSYISKCYTDKSRGWAVTRPEQLDEETGWFPKDVDLDEFDDEVWGPNQPSKKHTGV